MKKNLISLFLCGVLACSVLTGCSDKKEEGAGSEASTTSTTSKADDGVFTADEMLAALQYDIKPYVKLGDYTSLDVELNSEDYEITDEAIEEELASYITNYPYYVTSDRTKVGDDDIVKIDFVGKIEGEEFDGGSAEDYVLYIGMGEFIEGFEEGLIGKKVGETVVLNLTFPEDYYGDESIDGKDVEFTVDIKEIVDTVDMSIEEITDEYVKSSMEEDLGVATVEELKTYVKDSLVETNEDNKRYDTQSKIAEKLLEISEVNLPDELVNAQFLMYKDQIEQEATSEGMTFEEILLEYYGYENWDDLVAEMKDSVVSELSQSMVLDSLIKELELSVTAEELEEEYGFYAQMYGYDDFDTFCELYGGKVSLAIGYAEEKVLEILAESANVTMK